MIEESKLDAAVHQLGQQLGQLLQRHGYALLVLSRQGGGPRGICQHLTPGQRLAFEAFVRSMENIT